MSNGSNKRLRNKIERNGRGSELPRGEADKIHSDLEDAANLPYWEEERKKADVAEDIPRRRRADWCVRQILIYTTPVYVEGEAVEILGNALREANNLPAESRE